ncbi:alpha-hydroxy-acid oxidizing protein [Streptomyces sp. NPDC046942]|uniref:alpha-hydroxy-acid oxidizing protein n=1 Tax=Streptomyces sp. NPDC046942 TaxID=3155137 RepID=UPI0033F50068
MDIDAVATGPLWMQLYWLKRRDLIRRAEAAGFRAGPHRRRAQGGVPFAGRRQRIRSAPGIRAVNVAHDVMAAPHAAGTGSRDGESAIARQTKEQFDASITREDLAGLRKVTSLPLAFEGVLTGLRPAPRGVRRGRKRLVVRSLGARRQPTCPVGRMVMWLMSTPAG